MPYMSTAEIASRTECDSAGSLHGVVRGIIKAWEEEADLLASGKHPRRQGLPRTQVLQEECALRGCIADIRHVLDASNADISDRR